jgi:type IV pilus assembly protein PilP
VNKSGVALVLSSVTLVILGGCSSGHEDIQQWIRQQQQAAVPRVAQVAKPVPFVPALYTQSTKPDPFDMDRLTKVLKGQQGDDALCQVELNRRKEPLEAFPLHTITMVGSLELQHGQQVALIRANNLLYQIRVGNHLGQDFGKVTKITESAVDLREIIQNPTGECVAHDATMQLQQSQERSR